MIGQAPVGSMQLDLVSWKTLVSKYKHKQTESNKELECLSGTESFFAA